MLPKPTAKQVIDNMTDDMREIMWQYVALMQRIAPRVKICWALSTPVEGQQ